MLMLRPCVGLTPGGGEEGVRPAALAVAKVTGDGDAVLCRRVQSCQLLRCCVTGHRDAHVRP